VALRNKNLAQLIDLERQDFSIYPILATLKATLGYAMVVGWGNSVKGGYSRVEEYNSNL